LRKLNPSEPVVSANAVPSTRKAGSKTSAKAPGARAAKHSKAVVEEPATVPSVAAPLAVSPVASSSAAAPAVALAPAAPEPVAIVAPVVGEVSTPAAVNAVSKPVAVSQEEIAKLAYCYWADRGYQGGNPEEDWARAEKTLLSMPVSA